MIDFKEIDLKGIPEKEMDEETRRAFRSMKRGVRKAAVEYRNAGLTMVTADRDGKVVYKKP